MSKWTSKNIPNLEGKIAVVTGGNAGLGYQISLELARKNAQLVIACRSKEKGLKAIENIEQTLNRKINSDVICLDLTDISSVQAFAKAFKAKYNKLDILVNNAGVVSLKDRQLTKEGIDMHMATNHLGHFALVGLLLPEIKQSSSCRIVSMSSGAYHFAELDFDDINWEKRAYHKVKCYGASKLANLLFMCELERKFNEHGYSAVSVGAHPGLSASEGQKQRADSLFFKYMAQSVEQGALPALMAATEPHVAGNTYFGPKWKLRGKPTKEKLKDIVFDKALAKQLWQYSEETTGVKYQF